MEAGPARASFSYQLVWGQRFLQVSAALPEPGSQGRARGIPIDFIHAPAPVKPRKAEPLQAWEAYRSEQNRTKVSALAARRLLDLRKEVPKKRLICAVDGGFTNRALFSALPTDTMLIGRLGPLHCLADFLLLRLAKAHFLPHSRPFVCWRGL